MNFVNILGHIEIYSPFGDNHFTISSILLNTTDRQKIPREMKTYVIYASEPLVIKVSSYEVYIV